MPLSILHRTTYRHSSLVFDSSHHLPPNPRVEARQRVLRWRLKTPGHTASDRDADGNVVRMLALATARDYGSASPIRRVHVGGNDERLDVRVNILPFTFRSEAD